MYSPLTLDTALHLQNLNSSYRPSCTILPSQSLVAPTVCGSRNELWWPEWHVQPLNTRYSPSSTNNVRYTPSTEAWWSTGYHFSWQSAKF